MFGYLEALRGLPQGSVRIGASLESPLGIVECLGDCKRQPQDSHYGRRDGT